MRISDWSSDVCSSDLHRVETRRPWSWAAAGRMVADRRFLAFVAAAGSAQASHSVFYGFGTIAWRRIGFDDTVIGMLWTLGVVAEIVLFWTAGRPGRFGRPPFLPALPGIGVILRGPLTALAHPPPPAPIPPRIHPT